MSKLKRVYQACTANTLNNTKCPYVNTCNGRVKQCNRAYYLVPVEGAEIIKIRTGVRITEVSKIDTFGIVCKSDIRGGVVIWIPAKKEKGNEQ